MFHKHGTGAVKLSPDFRDYTLRLHPKVAPMMAAMPDSFSLRQYQKGVALNQGQAPACVAYSSCHMQSFYESIERNRQWIVFDGHLLYQENGGTGAAGVGTRDVLQDMQDRGCPVLGSADRYLIKQYAFVDFSSNFDLAIQTVKAAVAALCPVVLAMRLPSDFGDRECGKPNSTVMGPESYHQVMIGGFTPDGLDPFNSWGPGFADSGWCHLSTEFLARPEQQGFLYAFTTLDAPDLIPPPPPDPEPLPVEFDMTVGKIAAGGAVKILPNTPVALKKGMNFHCKQVV